MKSSIFIACDGLFHAAGEIQFSPAYPLIIKERERDLCVCLKLSPKKRAERLALLSVAACVCDLIIIRREKDSLFSPPAHGQFLQSG